MSRKLRILRDVVLPAALLVPLLGLITGCLYIPIPTFEYTASDSLNRDFRPYLTDRTKDRRILPGSITRSGVIGLIGSPYNSDGTTDLYDLKTQQGIQFEMVLLCFGVTPQQVHHYRLWLTYNPDGVLIQVRTSDTTEDGGSPLKL